MPQAIGMQLIMQIVQQLVQKVLGMIMDMIKNGQSQQQMQKATQQTMQDEGYNTSVQQQQILGEVLQEAINLALDEVVKVVQEMIDTWPSDNDYTPSNTQYA